MFQLKAFCSVAFGVLVPEDTRIRRNTIYSPKSINARKAACGVGILITSATVLIFPASLL
jgi:hypothetical protein